MKKIRRHVPAQHRHISPAFVIGYSHHEPPPAGFLAAWFTQTFEEQLDIMFPTMDGTTTFDAVLHHRKAHVTAQCAMDVASAWSNRLEWIHTQVAEVYPSKTSQGHDREQVLYLARLARGLTELTEGTAYDLGMQTYINPSDWMTQPLDQFRLVDHLRVEHVERAHEGRVWFHTRGLGKFGFEEIETYKGSGLPVAPVIETLTCIAEAIILRGHALRNGESIAIHSTGKVADVVRYRTDSTYGLQLNLREVVWT